MKSNIKRLESLLDQQEAAIRDAFLAFIEQATSDRVIAEVTAKLEQGDFNAALQIADAYVAQMAVVLPTAFQAVGAATAAELATAAPDVLVSLHFDPTHPRAAEIMRSRKLEMIQEFGEEQRLAARQAMEQAYMQGTGTSGMARAFRDSVGLTRYQERAVQRYADALRRGSREALDRSLRDRRFDRTVRNAIERDKPLTEEQIAKMVDRYRQRYRAYRAEVIARTESVRVMSEAREEATQQAIEQIGGDRKDVKRTWRTTGDGRTRDSHRAMSGQERGMDEPFRSGAGNALRYPGDANAPLSDSAQCRCVLTYDLGVSSVQQ